MSLNYKCPACGGTMSFDAASGMLKCDYCDHKIPVDSNTENEAESVTESARETEAEYADYHGYKCPSCGAEIVTDDNTAATFCSFCGSPTLVEDRMTGVMKPSRVIPFAIQKNQAKEMFMKWTKKGALTPPEFKHKASIDKLTGMYIPFWLFDYDADVSMSARAEKVRKEKRGNDEVEITEHYLVNRRIFVSYDKLPADASEKMDDDLMDMLEPFDYNNLKDFNNGFLSGFFAEKYDYTDKDLKERIEKRVKQYGKDAALSTIKNYDKVDPVSTNYKLDHKKSEYVMMPVWMFNYRWKGDMKTVAINGETGKIAGSLPTSPAIAAAWFGGIFAAITLLLAVTGITSAGTAAIIGGIAALIVLIVMLSGQSSSKVSDGFVYAADKKVDIREQDDIYVNTTEKVIKSGDSNQQS